MVTGLLLPGMALAYTGVFRSAFLSQSGSNPTGIAVGDFDSDGAVDAAVATGDGSELTIHVGLFSCSGGDRAGQFCFQATDCPGGMCKPDGTISQIDSIPLGSFPSAMLQGNFDSDSIPDLIVAHTNDDAVVFLKGLGNTDFFDDPSPPITVGRSPVGLAAADLDGDGKLDLVTANEGVDPAPGSITILKGDGTGGFLLVQQPDPSDPEGDPIDSLPADVGTRAVAIGNVDDDPALDILALNARSDANTISIFSGDGDGVFTPTGSLAAGEPQDLALRDLNGDGNLDLILANFNDDTVAVRFGDGDGGFGAATNYPVGTAPNRLAFGNLGGDTRPDLVVSNNRSGDVSVLLANGPGTFGRARNFVADAEPQALALGDFNDDGLLDAALATIGSDAGASVAVLRNRGGGALHAAEDLPGINGASDLTIADIDGDAFPDLIGAGGAGQVLIFRSNGAGFDPPTALNIGGRPLGVVANDINADAQPDIVASNSDNAALVVLRATGGGTFAAPMLLPTAVNPGAVTTGDFNNDGIVDLAVSTVTNQGVCQGGPNQGSNCTRDDECAPGGICGRPGMASVLLQQSDGSFRAARNFAVEETPIGIAAVDANCDDRDDLLVANVASNTVTLLLSTSTAAMAQFTVGQTLSSTQVGQSPITLTVADFDRDGVDDFAVANTVAPGSTPNVRLLRGNCSGQFAPFGGPGSQVRVGELPNAIVARDFTGDGFVDIAVTSQISNEICLLVGAGNGTTMLVGQGSCDGVSRMPIALAAGDFDEDGRYDVASANNAATANNLSVLSNCVRDVGCDPFPPVPPATPLPGTAARRGDGNNDGRTTAADLVSVGSEVMDDDGFRVEAIGQGDVSAARGVDANGDGRVDAQDRLAVVRRIFRGA